MQKLGIWYVIAFCLVAGMGCSLDANLADFNSQNQLFLSFDADNATISSSNFRSYAVKGSCEHTEKPVEIQVSTFGTFSTECKADKTFSVSLDLDGIQDGKITISASQDETEAKKTSLDQKRVLVDLTPPTVTIDSPDSATNYSASSLRSNYPIAGTCSDPFNVVKVGTSLAQEYFAVCSASYRWEIRLNLSVETANSIDFYVQHFDQAGNISTTQSVNIAYPQWHKISPDITATGVASVRLITQYGNTGRILLAAPLRNDDLVDLGIVNFNGTGLTRLNPISGQWALDVARPIISVEKYARALYTRSSVARIQLKELHSVKTDGTGDIVLFGPSPENPVGGVTTYALTPNQDTVIAIGDIEAKDNEFNLYAINVQTGVKIKLNGSMVDGGDVRDFIISPDGTQVVFRADKETDEAISLFAVKVDGTGLRRLGPAMSSGKTVLPGYTVSSNSKWVLFRDNQSFVSGSSAGSSVVSLETGEHISFAPSTTGFIEAGLFSPNGRYVAYRVDRTTVGCYAMEIYDLETRSELEVSPACPNANTDVFTYSWAPDSSKLAFGMATSASIVDLYIVNTDGSNRLKLTNAAVVRNGLYQTFRENSLIITNNQKIIFPADFSGVSPASAADMKYDLYSVKIDGSEAPIKLNSISPSSIVRDYPLISVSPSGDRVVFVADLEIDGKYDMYLAATDGSSSRRLNPPIASPQNDVLFTSQSYVLDWSRNTAAMLADVNIDFVNELHVASLSLTPSAPQYLSLPTVLSGDVGTVQASENKSKILFRSNPVVDSQMHLYVADADGSNVRRVTKDYPAGGGVMRSWIISADGSKVVYISDQDVAGQEELYVVNTSGGSPVKVSGAINAVGGNITAFKYIEATNQIVYLGDLTTDSVIDVYVVNADGTGNTKLSPAYSHAVNIQSWDVALDGSFVALRWDYRVDEKVEIDKISTAGGAPVAVNAPIGGSFDLAGFKISSDSQWICYWGTMAATGRLDARVANAVTPATNYLITNGVNSTQGASGCDFTPDSAYVLLTGDWYTDGKTSMKSFNIATQTLYSLNSSLPVTSHTSTYFSLVEGANKRVITLSESSPEVYELYSMNYDGTDLRKISATPYAGGQVNANNGTAVQIMDDADKTIVYSGLIETLGKWDLFAVKWDGTQKRKLVTLNANADIYDFTVFPGLNRIFYRADNERDGILTLYSVNADGTGVKNHTPGISGNTGAWAGRAVSNTHVFFTSDAYRSQTLELFVDPL